MSGKRKLCDLKTSSGCTKPGKSERLELATSISNIAAIQDKFTKAVEAFGEYKSEVLTNLDLEIETKKIELDALNEEYKKNVKDNQIRTDQQLSEYKYVAALEILEERKEVAITKEELTKLRATLEELKKDRTMEIDAMRKEEKSRHESAMHAALHNKDLIHKSEIAQVSAESNQKTKEIISLNASIENSIHQLSEQRKLTKEVAEAGRQPIHFTNGATTR